MRLIVSRLSDVHVRYIQRADSALPLSEATRTIVQRRLIVERPVLHNPGPCHNELDAGMREVLSAHFSACPNATCSQGLHQKTLTPLAGGHSLNAETRCLKSIDRFRLLCPTQSAGSVLQFTDFCFMDPTANRSLPVLPIRCRIVWFCMSGNCRRGVCLRTEKCR